MSMMTVSYTHLKLLNLVNPESSDCYNPLSHVRSEIDVDIIANTIIKGQKDGAGSSSSDPYWDLSLIHIYLKKILQKQR